MVTLTAINERVLKKLNRSIFTNFKPSHHHPLGNHEQSNVNPCLILCREDQRTSILLRPGHISTPSSTTTLRIRPLIGRFATAQPSRAIAGRSGHNCISAAAKVVALIPVLLLAELPFLPSPALSACPDIRRRWRKKGMSTAHSVTCPAALIAGTQATRCYTTCEPVWPSGKAGKREDLGSIPLRLSFLFTKVVVCENCLVTLSITSY